MLIFKEVEQYLTELNRELILNLGNPDAYDKVKRKQSVMELIHTFMVQGDWLVKENSRERFHKFVQLGYSYDKLSSFLGIEKHSIRSSISQMGKRFLSVVDAVRIMDDLKSDNFHMADNRLSEAFNDLKPLFLFDVRDKIYEGELSKGIRINDCKHEVMFLQRFTTWKFLEVYNKLDSEKFNHILAILNDKTGVYKYEQDILISYIKGNIKKWEEVDFILKDVLPK